LVKLPSGIDAEKIEAVYKDGLLTVTLRKTDEVDTRTIPVTVD
jgi:HSP20 family molecular chaperone IbpA